MQTALIDLGLKEGDFPVSEDASARVFSLPMGPYLSEADQSRVLETLYSLEARAA